jgi:hypothetical protein
LVKADLAEALDLLHAGGWVLVIEQGGDATEALFTEELFSVEPAIGLAKLGVALVRHLPYLCVKGHRV